MLFHRSDLPAPARARIVLPALLLIFMLVLSACNNNSAATGADVDAEAPAPPIAAAPEEPAAPTVAPTVAPAEEPAAASAEESAAPAEAPEESAPPAEDAPQAPEAADASAATRTFRIVPEASVASYAVEEEFFNRAVRYVTAVGRTSAIEGELNLSINENTVVLGENSFTVDLRTLTSDSGQRDRRIRSEWLESNSYPWAEFRATDVQNFPADAAEGQPITFELVGDLTIREVTQPVTFATIAQLDGDTLTATAVTQVLMRDFGFEPPNILGMLTVTDGVTVTVELTAQASE